MTRRRPQPTTAPIEAEFIIEAPKTKRRARLEIGGANRGATAALSALADFNATSDGIELVATYVDPVPGRAASLALAASDVGVRSDHLEGRIEDQRTAPDVRVYHLDRPGSFAASIEQDIAAHRAFLGYLVILLPNGMIAGVRMANRGDRTAAEEKLLLLRGLDRVTARRGGRTIFGESGDVRHARLEPLIRQWFADHATSSIGKFASGIDIDGYPIEVTFDGSETLSLHVVTSANASDPNELAAQVLDSPNAPLQRGTRFMVVELLPDAVRFHEVRYRTDGRVLVRSSQGFSQADVEVAEQRRADADDARRKQQDAAARSLALINNVLTHTATRSNPIASTD